MKTINKSNELARGLQNFFASYLPGLRGVSPHTIHSYRDCLALLLRFISTQLNCSVIKVNIENINAEQIVSFLQMLEDDRNNCPTVLSQNFFLPQHIVVIERKVLLHFVPKIFFATEPILLRPIQWFWLGNSVQL